MSNAVVDIDPRAYSTAEIKAPAPLPYVSREALLKVRHPLPAPTICPNCGSDVVLASKAEIYGGDYGPWPYAYLCSKRACDSFVGVHPETDIPLGTLADKQLRTARQESKAAFNAAMKETGKSRSAMYKWLASAMQIEAYQCHFAWFDLRQCEQARQLCER